MLVVSNSTLATESNVAKRGKFFKKKLINAPVFKQNEKPVHIAAYASFFIAIAAIFLVGSMPLIVYSTGFLAYEFGYIAFLLALGGIILAICALADMQREPDFWKGKKRAKAALWMGILSATGTWLAFWWVIKKA